MKKFFTFVFAMIGMATTASAQDFAYQFNGETLDDGSTVVIEAELDFFGDPECNTNPYDDNKRLTFKKLGSTLSSKGSATITIEQNSFGTTRMQWLMGGNCVSVSTTTYTKDFDFNSTAYPVVDNAIKIQYDIALTSEQYGEMLTKLVSTIGGTDYTVYIKFTYTKPSPIITFADSNVKALCVANWDTNGDGELSEEETAAVTDLGTVFIENTEITSFNELQFFTGLTTIVSSSFSGCTGLTSVTIPVSVTTIGEYNQEIEGETNVEIIPVSA